MNYMQAPSIRMIEDRFLVGDHISVSVQQYDVSLLWKRFMPIKKQLTQVVSPDLYSISVYPSNYFQAFDPSAVFEKWAAVEVTADAIIPEGLHPFILPGGRYAVFEHKGDARAFSELLQYIYEIWLPRSGHVLDHRPHFEILGEKYKNNDTASEEEVWIPIRVL